MNLFKTSFFFLFLVILKTASAQTHFQKLDAWLDQNTREMGGRAILVIYKDGKLVYNHSANDMNMRQKMAARYIARKQGKTADMEEYSLSTRLNIASCSKWYSAALVMTFVDEGKLKLSDTVGKFLPVLSQHGKGGITISQ